MPSVLRPNHKFLASSVNSEWPLSIFLHCDPSAGCLNFPSFLQSSLCHRSNLACSLFLNRRFNRGIIWSIPHNLSRNPLPRGLVISLSITRVILSDLVPTRSAYRAFIHTLVLTAVQDAVINACMYLLHI